jgi:hypothetical protein
MKQSIIRLLDNAGKDKSKSGLRSALLMVLVFLTFWSVSFYVLVNSMA